MRLLIWILAVGFTPTAGAAPITAQGQVTVVRGETQPPSCAKVTKRLNEMSSRMRELGYVAKSFNQKQRLSPAEIQEFSELVRRALMPNFGRIDRNVEILARWTLKLGPDEEQILSQTLPVWRKRIQIQTLQWDDPNGFLPSEIELSLISNVLQVRYLLTAEQYCLGNPEIRFDLENGPTANLQLRAVVPTEK